MYTLPEFNGDYEKYEDFIFNKFKENYISGDVFFENSKIAFKIHPIVKGKHEAFWHMTSTNDQGTRLPDLNRYKTIDFPKHILDKCYPQLFECSKVWQKRYKSKERIILLCDELNYVIVLEIRLNYILFITSYPITRDHTRRKLLNEYNSKKVVRLK